MAGVASNKGRLGTLIPAMGASGFGRSLRDGLVCGGIVLLLLLGWMALRANQTAQRLQNLIPVKTAVIEVPEVPEDPDAPNEALNGSKNINALPVAPLEGLTENLSGKLLPVSRIEDDMTPFQAYKKPFSYVAGRAMISIVIMDYGLSSTLAQSVLDNMPPEITLVLTPYASEPAKWAAAARAYGHEFWLSLPMQAENLGADDTGPHTLMVNASKEENQKRLFDVLGVAVGYAGVVTGQDHVFTRGETHDSELAKQIFARGLAMTESNPEIPAYGLKTALEFGYPYVQNTFWIDRDLRPEAIDQTLKDLELQATRKGKVVAFLHPYPLAVNKVQEWMKQAEQKGLQIAPLSAMVQ